MVAISPTGRRNPRMTFSALCEYLAATPVRQRSILKEQKYPTPAVWSYRRAICQLQDFATVGTPLKSGAPNLAPHEKEVVDILIGNGWRVPAPTARKPNTHQPAFDLNGVELAVFPDLLLGASGHATGSLKFYFAKGKPLSPDVGQWMATLLHHYQTSILADASTDPRLCIVYDVRKNTSHAAAKRKVRLVKNVEAACSMIAAAWPTI